MEHESSLPCSKGPKAQISYMLHSLQREIVSPSPNHKAKTTPCRLSATAYSIYTEKPIFFIQAALLWGFRSFAM